MFRSLLDPFRYQLIFPRIVWQSQAALVFDRQRWLLENQAARWFVPLDSSTLAVGNRLVVHQQIVAKKTESESSLALRGAMARAGVAPQATNEWRHVSFEVDLVDLLTRWKEDGLIGESTSPRQRTGNHDRREELASHVGLQK